MKRKLLVFLLICVLVITFVPVTNVNAAEDEYNLYVGGVKVTSANAGNITGSGISGKVTYDASSNTLHLYDATIKGSYSDGTTSAAVYYGGSTYLTIIIDGINNVYGDNISAGTSTGIYSTTSINIEPYDDFRISQLEVRAGNGTGSVGIMSQNAISIAKKSSSDLGNYFQVIGRGGNSTTGGSIGIYAKARLTVNYHSLVEGHGGNSTRASSIGMYSASSDIRLYGNSHIFATGASGVASYGMYADTYTISDVTPATVSTWGNTAAIYGIINDTNLSKIKSAFSVETSAKAEYATNVWDNSTELTGSNYKSVRLRPAGTEYDLWVAGTRVTEDNRRDVLGEGTVNVASYSTYYAINLDSTKVKIMEHTGAVADDWYMYSANYSLVVYAKQQSIFILSERLEYSGVNGIGTDKKGGTISIYGDTKNTIVDFDGAGKRCFDVDVYGIKADKFSLDGTILDVLIRTPDTTATNYGLKGGYTAGNAGQYMSIATGKGNNTYGIYAIGNTDKYQDRVMLSAQTTYESAGMLCVDAGEAVDTSCGIYTDYGVVAYGGEIYSNAGAAGRNSIGIKVKNSAGGVSVIYSGKIAATSSSVTSDYGIASIAMDIPLGKIEAQNEGIVIATASDCPLGKSVGTNASNVILSDEASVSLKGNRALKSYGWELNSTSQLTISDSATIEMAGTSASLGAGSTFKLDISKYSGPELLVDSNLYGATAKAADSVTAGAMQSNKYCKLWSKYFMITYVIRVPGSGTTVYEEGFVEKNKPLGSIYKPTKTSDKGYFEKWIYYDNNDNEVDVTTDTVINSNMKFYDVWHTHSYVEKYRNPATCQVQGYVYEQCSCGLARTQTLFKVSHKYSDEYTIDVEPTNTTTGVKSQHCVYEGCTSSINSTEIPVLKNGLYQENGKWYYYANGEIDTDKVGLVENAGYWWYVNHGVIDTNYTGFFENSAGKWYVSTGKIDVNFTGLAYEDGKWLCVRNGRYYPDYTGLVQNAGDWWYVVNGELDTTYEGLLTNDGGTWFIKGGKVMKETGIYRSGDKFYYVSNGKVMVNYTGIVKNEGAFWYIENGILNQSYTGLFTNSSGTWYIVKGKLNTEATSVTIDGITYLLHEGKVVGQQ